MLECCCIQLVIEAASEIVCLLECVLGMRLRVARLECILVCLRVEAYIVLLILIYSNTKSSYKYSNTEGTAVPIHMGLIAELHMHQICNLPRI